MTTFDRTPLHQSLIEGRDGFRRSVAEAKRWLAYNEAALAHYETWLADPNLEPPSRPFPDYPGQEPDHA